MILEAKKRAAEEQKEQEGTGLKILTPKQMLQRLPIALAQVKAGHNSESLLNEVRQIVYSLYQAKQITKKYTTTKLNQFNKITCNIKDGHHIYEFRKQ